MPSPGTLVTRSSVISDFIVKITNPVRNATWNPPFGFGGPQPAYHSGLVPTSTTRVWENGSIVTSAPYTAINTSALSTKDYSDPTAADFPSAIIYASEVLNACRAYARLTTRLRTVIFGVIYTQYYNGQYTRTGVPSDDPNAHAGGVITGSLVFGVGDAHLTSSYLLNLAAPITSQPAQSTLISATNFNSFLDNLRQAVINAQTAANNTGLPDLRVCHSSCHNNCHGSRGRR